MFNWIKKLYQKPPLQYFIVSGLRKSLSEVPDPVHVRVEAYDSSDAVKKVEHMLEEVWMIRTMDEWCEEGGSNG